MITKSQKLRRRLEEERGRLSRDLLKASRPERRLISAHSGGYSSHLAEDASETFERERDLTLEVNLRKLLDGVEHALRKFEAGTYGRCDECGEPIDGGRLEALPYARLCIRCQMRQERGGRGQRP